MITAGIEGAAELAARLADKARRIAEARAGARGQGAARWRSARRLWPLFARS